METLNKKQSETEKAPLGFWQLWNMSFGFFGIQFGWTLQMANTSAIYEYLGANPEQIPILWLAAPVSGLIAQPVIGYMSDRTWTRLGRRRPYFLIGAIFSSIALVLMPNSSSLWMAAGLLWILDTSVNVSMEPFRAFVSDIVPDYQVTKGYAMQSFFVGLGAVVASLFPWVLSHIFGFSNHSGGGASIPLTVKISYYAGAAVFLSTVLWTVFSTKETPPANLKAFRRRQERNGGFMAGLRGILKAVKMMPQIMKQLGWVQFFSWLGIFCMFLYFPPAVGHRVFGAIDESSELYTEGIEWAGLCIALYNAVCFVFSLFISRIADLTSRKATHSFCLLCGGAGLITLWFTRDPYLMLFPVACFGLTWASILTMPYAMLSDVLPVKETGIYMGIFNAFIVMPQIVAALGLGWVMQNFLDNNRLLAVVLGGVSLVIAAFLVQFVRDVGEEKTTQPREKLSAGVQAES